MKILIVGGSNSLIRDGYVKYFSEELRHRYETVEFRNVSIGGTVSLTSLVLLDQLNFHPDLVIFEYSLNDTGHLNHLEKGSELKKYFLGIIFNFLARRFPEAKVLPLILSASPFYDMKVRNTIYLAELDFWRRKGIQPVDMRRQLFELFGTQAPEFLYSDTSHFHRGAACALIGKFLAAAVPATLALQRSLGQLNTSHSENQLDMVDYYSARDLMEGSEGNTSLEPIFNRHLNLECVKVMPGGRVRIPSAGNVLMVAFVSDDSHQSFTLVSGSSKTSIAARHVDVKAGKIVLTSVPLIIRSFQLGNECHEWLALDESNDPWVFDCFLPPGMSQAQTSFSLAGLLIQR
ncbi:SGNH/GDSL hydrolase family protein [Ensifer sp. ENS09]|uniref:SGNH/GDSL hydrolase family protein n=1 Tax=Ensifer sp. ENS09 TaxID=2769263 RepID=UPI00177D0D05|nr:SGNH/GDSL hydrolase family protein [Ensifer sp. ENS09]MBD9653013.1 SGNH/GDSL hydrolase family protein [Ensifer sp. ENS09]